MIRWRLNIKWTLNDLIFFLNWLLLFIIINWGFTVQTQFSLYWYWIIYFNTGNWWHYYSKSSSLSLFTLNINFSTHFFNDMLANAKAETSSLFVHSLRISKFAKIMKQFTLVLRTNSHSRIFYTYFKSDEVFFEIILILNLIFNYLIIILQFIILFEDLLAKDNPLNRFNLNRYVTIMRSKLECIWQKVQENLSEPALVAFEIYEKWKNFVIDD